MKQKRLATALLASLVISALCTYMLSRKMGVHAPETVPDAMYVAPARSMKAGEILSADSVELVPWPGNRPLRSAFVKTGDVFGRAILYPLEKGEPILERDVSAAGVGAGLAAKIPEGMRAIALRSDEVAGVAGFLTPGSHVDVLVTYHFGQSPDPLTATVLQNAEVIAVGQRAQPDPEGKPSTVAVVTLLLTPEESERAVLASTQGAVHFVLRNGADKDKAEHQPMYLSMLAGGPPPAPLKVAPAAAPDPSPRVHTPVKASPGIEIVLGNEASAAKQDAGAQP